MHRENRPPVAALEAPGLRDAGRRADAAAFYPQSHQDAPGPALAKGVDVHMSAPFDPQAHDAPLLWLRDQLHAGTTLEERVRKLRWKRRKAKTGDACEGIVVIDPELERRVTALAATDAAEALEQSNNESMEQSNDV